MLRVCASLLFASALVAAPVPELPKAVKDRKAVLAELGIPDTGQKLPPVPDDYRPDADSDTPLRAACKTAAQVLLAHRATPLPDTFSFAAGPKKAKEAMKAVQVTVATRTLDIEEVLEALDGLTAEQRAAEKSKRWRATHRFLIAAAEQEGVLLHEYNLAIGRVLTETVEPPTVDEVTNALKLEPAAKLMSQKKVRLSAKVAEKEFEVVIEAHPDTPWAALAEAAKDRPLGLTWVPAKADPPKAKKR
jgi:hypothetical protein